MKYFFDMDGCICESRQTISPEMKEKLESLGTVVVISGAERSRMETQLNGLKCDIMAQSGNDTDLWKNTLLEAEISEIEAHINQIIHLTEGNDKLVDNRGSQVSLSFTGHDAPIELKNRFDPKKLFRTWLLDYVPFNSETLEVRVAGTTCLDYTRKNGTKGKNIERFIQEKGWNKEDCIYFGDNLQKGGNDETVIGIITTVEVANPTELLTKLNNI